MYHFHGEFLKLTTCSKIPANVKCLPSLILPYPVTVQISEENRGSMPCGRHRGLTTELNSRGELSCMRAMAESKVHPSMSPCTTMCFAFLTCIRDKQEDYKIKSISRTTSLHNGLKLTFDVCMSKYQQWR